MSYLPSLSKSKFVSGVQCEKKLWLSKHQPEEAHWGQAQEAVFASGTSVGELATQLFPGGTDARPENMRDFKSWIKESAECLENGVEVIYEAAFSVPGAFVALDIFVRVGDEIHAYEVKSNTGLHEYHITDTAFQYWVMEQAGYCPDKIFFVHINSSYVRKGELDVQQLFHKEDITELVLANQAMVEPKLRELQEMLEGTKPNIDIGPHCSNPFLCEFKNHCWSGIPENSVFELAYVGAKAWEYYHRGLLQITDLDETDLQKRQVPQFRGLKFGESRFEIEPIKDFLNAWEYPLYFLDFETINPAVPIYEGSRPYQQICFQYSLHGIKEPGGELEHFEYLAQDDEDPRPKFIEQMLQECGSSGSIVVYNEGFEKGRIAELAHDFPEHSEKLLALNERVEDLLIPFRSHWCYTPAMGGSASIKSVLPALTDLSYNELEISDGGTASETFKAMAEGRFEGDFQKTRTDLLEYCKMDTLAMVEVWRYLVGRLGEV